MESKLKGKKILLVGLGILGGGVATAKWFLKQGVNLTITDLHSRKELSGSLRALGRAKYKIRFVPGRHGKKDFISHDLIVINPAVKIIGNKYLSATKRAGIPITNDLAVFFDNVENLVIAVTGTRGKTTTTNWIAHFLRAKHKGVRASGNSSDEALLKLLPKLEKNKKTPAVLELSSFQLELELSDSTLDNLLELSGRYRAPDVAVITNLYRDHINRHETMKNYALAKANIFKNQNEKQKLILNFDNKWTKFFLKQKPKSKIYFISTSKLPRGLRGLTIAPARQPLLIRANRKIVFCDGKKKRNVFSEKTLARLCELGEHNLYNFLAAALAAHFAGISWKEIENRTKTLPQVFLRQEIILKKKNLMIINDSAGTSPEATIAAIRRFSGIGELILIIGGTDKKLEFRALAREIKKTAKPENLFLLNGSATKKMIYELKRIDFWGKTRPNLFGDLKSILSFIQKTLLVNSYKLPITILFSPGAASFEKFKNEFDRGEKFNIYSKKLFN